MGRLSDKSLVRCDVCKETCKRGVMTPCCSAPACRGCAVKTITGFCRCCWGCGKGMTTGELVNCQVIRAAVEMIGEIGVMEEEQWEVLNGRREKEKVLEENKTADAEKGDSGERTEEKDSNMRSEIQTTCDELKDNTLDFFEGSYLKKKLEKQAATYTGKHLDLEVDPRFLGQEMMKAVELQLIARESKRQL